MKITELSTEALLGRKAIAALLETSSWAFEAHGDTGDYGVGILLDDNGVVVSGEQQTGKNFIAEVIAVEVKKAGYAAHIAANDPPTVIATIDELLRLREENERLKEGLENALHVNELRLAEIAKTLITGLAEGITGNSGSVTAQIRATCVHCNASFTRAEEATAHDNVCPKHPANIRAGRLEKEIDWLAQAAANCEWMGRRVSPKFMREAARRAVESADE